MTNLSEYIVNLIPETVAPKFVGELPSLSTEGVAIAVFNSGVNTTYFGTPEAIYRPVVRVIVRHKDYPTGCMFAQTIQETLRDYTDETLLSVTAVGTPNYLGRSAEKLHEFQSLYQILLKE